ncbi:MAG: energy transducer TonB [Bacteroidales bacterium]|jgi:protein TonB
MKRKLFFILFFLFILNASAQNQNSKNTKTSESKVSQKNIKSSKNNEYNQNMNVELQKEPMYPQGEKALYEYFYYNIKYSDEAKAKKINGEVIVSFDVAIDSTLKNIQIFKRVGFGIDEEIIRLLKPLKYAPAIQNDVPVKMNVVITVPVRADH